MRILMKKFRHWFFNLPFAFRLNLTILPLLTAAFLLLFFSVLRYSVPLMEMNIFSEASDEVSDITNAVSTAVKRTETTAKLIKHAMEHTEDQALSALKHRSNSIMNIVDPDKKFFHSVFIYYLPKGNQPEKINVIANNGKEKGTFSTNNCGIYHTREWFSWTLKEKKQHWTEPYIADDEADRPTLVTFSIPFQKHGSSGIDGILGLTIRLQNIQKYFSGIEFKGNGKALLISRNGLYISHPDPKIQMNKTIFQLAEETGMDELKYAGKEIGTGKSGMIYMEKSTVVKGDSVVFFYDTVKSMNWGVCLVFSKHDYFAKLRALNLKIFTSIITTLILLAIVVTKLSRDLTRSLKKLSDVAQAYGAGNFEAKFPNLYGKDEIGKLADAFRNMRDNLIAYIDKEKSACAFEQKLSVEMETASRIQNSILPRHFPDDRRFSISAIMQPAKEVGGDFYDCFYLGEDKYAISVADVSGKGIPASLFMMMSKGLIKTISSTSSGLSLADIFNKANSILCENNEAEMFITVFMAVIDLRTGTAEYVNAGHNPPLLKHNGKYEFLKPLRNLTLAAMDTVKYKSGSFALSPGDSIFLYTDGVNEAQNSKKEFFGNERLKQTLNSETLTSDSAETVETVKESLYKFSAGTPQADDITMLVFSYKGDLTTMKTPEEKNADKKSFSEKRNFIASIEEWDNVSAFIERKSTEAGIAQPGRMKLLISAEEIFSNIANYAYKEPGNADITVAAGGGMFKVIFEDSGIEYNPLEKEDPDITLSAEERKIGGLGIFIVKKSMDLVKYERKGNKNIFTMGLKL